jgi:hypothetical protein
MSLITTQASGSSVLDIDGKVPQVEDVFRNDSMYLVDFSKLESVNDLIAVIAAMGVSFHKSHPHFHTIAKFLATDSPIPINPTKSEQQV